jgi:hypothetical protein
MLRPHWNENMARKKHKKKRPVPLDTRKVARPDWARFRVSYHGRGPHRDKSVYKRKLKHQDTDDATE